MTPATGRTAGVRLRVLSLGAGVQSTTLLLMALDGEIERPDCAIFADTGWEPSAVYRHLAWLRESGELRGLPIHVVSVGNIREDTLGSVGGGKVSVAQAPFFVKGDLVDARGRPERGRLWRKCTRAYKIEPVVAFIRRHYLGLAKGQRVPNGVRVEQWLGISRDERQRQRMSRDAWIDLRYPLIERGITRQDCVAWLSAHGYSVPPKSSCIGCPFHSDDYWLDMRDNRPEEWADATAFDEGIRRGLPMVNGEAFVHASMVPLRDIDLRSPYERGVLTLWDQDMAAECDGVCGT